MSGKSSEKSKLWLYAVILFSSAFIVLLITAYSQIKLNNSIIDYKKQIHSIEKKNDNFEFNLNSTLKLNKDLNKRIKEMDEEISDLSGKLSLLEDENSKFDNKNKNVIKAYEALIAAQIEFDAGNYANCALLLRDECDTALLEKKASEKYLLLVKQSYIKAAHQFYITGYDKYKSKAYIEAIDNFKKSLEFTVDEYYSDDCYYLIAYGYYFENNPALAQDYLRQLLDKYPDSSYAKDAEYLLKVVSEQL